MASNKEIVISGDLSYRKKTALTGEAFTPGHALEYNSSGEFIKQSVADADTLLIFALANEEAGGTISDAYASGETAKAFAAHPGSEINALVAASASAIVIGNRVELAGDGTVRILASGKPVGVALEAVDNSGGGTEARIKIAVI